jgi:hypothetical protein
MTWLRRLVAVALVGGIALLAGIGWLGTEVVPQEFTAKTIVIRPDDASGLRITEYVDLDTGTARRRGYFRELPTTLGEPRDITARSPNAPDVLTVTSQSDKMTIEVGDPDERVRGRFRYVLAYTLPDAALGEGTFQLDVVGVNETLPTRTITVYVTGMQLTDTRCAKGADGTAGGCDLTAHPVGFEAVTSLEPGEGLLVAGRVAAFTTAREIAEPPLAPPRSYDETWVPVPVLAGVSAGGLALTWWWSRRRGRNEVSGITAADVAFGSGPGTRLLTDAQLSRLATLEVAPPRGLAPWEGAVLLREAIDDHTVEAWWAHAAAVGRVVLSEESHRLVITDVADAEPMSDAEERALKQLFSQGVDRFEVGEYDPGFASAWSTIRQFQAQKVSGAAWWRHDLPSISGRTPPWTPLAVMVTSILLLFCAITGWTNDTNAAVVFVGSLPLMAALVAAVSLVVGWGMTASLRASRTAIGSALALQTMSFRRFLAASEGRHVDEAWKRGVLREYTAWAVALGEADTWKRAAGASTLPAEAVTTMALAALVVDHRRSLSGAHTKPSTNSGPEETFGTVGSGGGGGRSGSW